MFLYWLLFIIPAFLSVYAPAQFQQKQMNILWLGFLMMLIILIGFRYQVGGDWLNYMEHLYVLRTVGFQELSFGKEAMYILLTWLGAQWGGIYLFNLTASILFSVGLIRFCLLMHRPWLCLTIAIPYLVIVMGMGYTRQSAALGALMLGLCALEKKQNIVFLFWIGIGYMFHQTCFLMMPLIFWFKKQSIKGENFLIILLMLPFIYEVYSLGISQYSQNYLLARYSSSGALIRLCLNCFPGLLYLIFKKRFLFSPVQHKVCQLFSICSVVLLGLYYVVPSSTALDRFALYFQPIQLMVWSQVPDVFGIKNSSNLLAVFLVIFIYAAIEFFWLFYGHYSNSWIPYRFYWWEVLTDRIWMFNPLTQYI